MSDVYDMDDNLNGAQESSATPWRDVGDVLNKEGIERFLSRLAVYAEAKYFSSHAQVSLRKNVGTSLYYAEGETGIRWLEKNAHRIDRKPEVSIYHLRYGEPVKEA